MIYVGVILGIGIMAGMVFMAFDKKSNFPTRIACIIALGIMVLTVIVCLVLVFTDDRVPVDPSVLIVGAVPEPKPKNSTDSMVLILMIILMAALFVVVAVSAIRDYKKNVPKNPKGGSSGGLTSLI